MAKFPMAADIVRRELRGAEIVETRRLTRAQLERIHTPDYLNKIRDHGLTRYERNRLGLPAHDRLYDRSILGASGSVMAAHAALEDGIACNLAGGTHHAFADRGHGFCVLNDVALAVKDLRRHHPDLHILVVDTDAHQGNGTHALLRDDPLVTAFSIHVGRNFPAKKEPGDCDVPLARFVSGRDYLFALHQALDPLFEQIEPDLVLWIAGADNHENDRFGQMKLSSAEMETRDRYVLGLCQTYAAPVAVLYGGAYNRDLNVTARLHAATVATALEFAQK